MKKNRRHSIFFTVLFSAVLMLAYVVISVLGEGNIAPTGSVYAETSDFNVADVEIFGGCTDYDCGSWHIDEVDERITNNEMFRFLIDIDNSDGVPYRITLDQPAEPPFLAGDDYSFDIDAYQSVITRPRWQFSSLTPWKNGTFEALLVVHVRQITSEGGATVLLGKKKDVTIRMHFNVYGVDKYNGWKKIGGEWCYFKNGASITNSWQKDSKGWMYLDSNGKISKSVWARDSKGYCWIAGDGYMTTATKWIQDNGGWYYIEKGYRVQNAWKKDSHGWCYLGPDGRMITNDWARDSKGLCWIGSAGYMLEETRLVEYEGDTYGIENGYMIIGRTVMIGGTSYTFDNNGKLMTGGDVDDTYTLSIDMQGHGDNGVIDNLSSGAELQGIYHEWLSVNYGDESPAAEGFVYDGINLKPLTSYDDWDSYYADKEALLQMTLQQDTTVYAMWLPVIANAEATIDAPVAGMSAKSAPVVHWVSGSHCTETGAKWSQGGEYGLTGATGVFEEGRMYYIAPLLTPIFPYSFSENETEVTVNGTTYTGSEWVGNFFFKDTETDPRGISIRLYPYIGLPAEESSVTYGNVDVDAEPVDFGRVEAGFQNQIKDVQISNGDPIPYRISFEPLSNSLFDVTFDDTDVAAGDSIPMSIVLSGDSEYAQTSGVYEDLLTLHATQITHVGGEVVPAGTEVVFSVTLRVVITDADDACTVCIDMQGHGENAIIDDMGSGVSLLDIYYDWLQASYGDESPAAEGYVFAGINLKPLSSYEDWDGFFEDWDALSDMTLQSDVTVYAMWLPEIKTVEATIDAPVAGTSAQGSPVIHLSSDSHCTVTDASWFQEGEDGFTEATGVFEDGTEYYVSPVLTPDYPYSFSQTGSQVTINGEVYSDISLYASYYGYGKPIDDDYGISVRPYPYLSLRAETGSVSNEPVTLDIGGSESWYTRAPRSWYFREINPYEISEGVWSSDLLEGDLWSFPLIFNTNMNTAASGNYYLIQLDGEDADEFWYWEQTADEDDGDIIKRGDIHEVSVYLKRESPEGASSGEYHASLKLYTDPSGMGNFDLDAPATVVDFTCVVDEERAGWHVIDGRKYYYENDYYGFGPWLYSICWDCDNDDEYYYFRPDGSLAANEWFQEMPGSSVWLYAKSDGRVACNEWIKDGDKWYYLRESVVVGKGDMVTNSWIKSGGYWYYLKKDGTMATNEWAKDSGGWMWMDANGRITKSKWIKDKGEWYYLKANGYMAANEWTKDSGGWMYMNASGKITKNKWVKDGGYWYYLKANGYMATGTQVIDGKTYRFDSSGRWVQ